MMIRLTEARLKYRCFFLFCIMLAYLAPVYSNAEVKQVKKSEVVSPIVYSGFFSREENDGKMARLSGKSHYMKFFKPYRVIRLFIPYPYSTTLKPEVINEVFHKVGQMTVGDSFIRGKFGVLEQDAIVNIGKVKSIDDFTMFDCDASAPCRIQFMEKGLKIIKKGILADHIIMYNYIDK
ncbi:MAG: hypothetical protein HN826_15960 [Methylococcales bacterium]|nr:hypothetical protein [Methylococcales bacterium]